MQILYILCDMCSVFMYILLYILANIAIHFILHLVVHIKWCTDAFYSISVIAPPMNFPLQVASYTLGSTRITQILEKLYIDHKLTLWCSSSTIPTFRRVLTLRWSFSHEQNFHSLIYFCSHYRTWIEESAFPFPRAQVFLLHSFCFGTHNVADRHCIFIRKIMLNFGTFNYKYLSRLR